MSDRLENCIDGSRFAGSVAAPLQALQRFYEAFNAQDMALMEQAWERAGEISMDNPLGGIKRGWNEIRLVYEQIFSAATPVRVEFFDYTLHEFSDIFFAVGRERPLGGQSKL